MAALALPGYYYESERWSVEYRYPGETAEAVASNLSTNYEALTRFDLNGSVGTLAFDRWVQEQRRACGTSSKDCPEDLESQAREELYRSANAELVDLSFKYLYLRNTVMLQERVVSPPRRHTIERQLRTIDDRLSTALEIAVERRQSGCGDISARACFMQLNTYFESVAWEESAREVGKAMRGDDPYRKIVALNSAIAEQSTIPHLQFTAAHMNAVISGCHRFIRQGKLEGVLPDRAIKPLSFTRKMGLCFEWVLDQELGTGESERIAS
jgi:hypothetical protein